MKSASFFTYQGVGRISIARWAPRKSKAGYARFPELAPPAAWHNLSHLRFAERYFERLSDMDAEHVWEDLHQLAEGHEPVLQCWETPQQIRDHVPGKDACHRHLIALWFEAKLGVRVPELGAEDEDFVDPAIRALILAG